MSFLNNPEKLIQLVGITSLVAIILSASIFYAHSRKTEFESSSLLQLELTDRFVEKQDMVNVRYNMSELHIPVSTTTSVYLVLDPIYLQQAYSAYIWMLLGEQLKLNTLTIAGIKLPTIATTGEYQSLVKVGDIDNADKQTLLEMDQSIWWAQIESIIFWIMVVVQGINTFLAVRLFYVERKIKRASIETKTETA